MPTCEHDLSESVLLRPTARRQWFVCLQELESLAQESLDRRAARLQVREVGFGGGCGPGGRHAPPAPIAPPLGFSPVACRNQSGACATAQLTTPSGLPLVYIADRMDIDDPLWGYQIRCAKTGWLQGFITLTVFTTWTHYFEWNSLAPASGMAAARIANAMIGKPDPAIYVLDGVETAQQVPPPPRRPPPFCTRPS